MKQDIANPRKWPGSDLSTDKVPVANRNKKYLKDLLSVLKIYFAIPGRDNVAKQQSCKANKFLCSI